MSMRTLLQKLGLKKEATSGSTAAPTRLDKLTGALHLSLESIEKADLSPEERGLLVEETMSQFRAAVLKAKDDKVPKVKEEGVEDEDESEDEFGGDDSGEEEGEEEGEDEGNPFSGGDADEDDDDEDIPEEEEEEMENVKKVAEMATEITALTKRLTDAEARAISSEERVTKFEQAEAERQFIAKAEKLVAGTAVPVEQAVVLLKSGGEAGETALTAILKSAREALADAQVFKELGSAAGVKVGGEIESAAGELRKADPKLTHEQAIAKAYRENPALYDAAIAR